MRHGCPFSESQFARCRSSTSARRTCVAAVRQALYVQPNRGELQPPLYRDAHALAAAAVGTEDTRPAQGPPQLWPTKGERY